MRRRLLLLLAAVWLAPATAQGQGVVSGRVVEAESGQPVPGAYVRVVGMVLAAVADDSGRFVLRQVPAGARQLAVERIGYGPRRVDVYVRAGGEAQVEVELEARAVAVGGVVASVSQREAGALEAPVSVSVLDNEEIAQRSAETVADAVAYAPSVQFVGENINIRGSSGYSRGTGSRVLLLVDGVPINAGDSGALNWDVLPLTEVARVEVVKGAGSALYGTSALGGVVNVVTAAPPERPLTRLRLRGGFYDDPPHREWIWSGRTLGYGSVEVSHSRRLGGLGIWARGGRWTDDGYRQNGENERWNAALRLTAGGESDSLNLFGSWAREDHGAALLWCTRGQCPDDERLAFQPLRVPSDARDDQTISDKARAYVTHRRQWTPGFSTFERVSLSWNDWETDFGDEVVGAESYVLGGELETGWRLASWLYLTLGSEVEYTEVEANLFGSHDLKDLAVYGETELGLTGWLTFTAGARGDVRLVDGGSLTDPWSSQISPRAGLVLSPDALTRVRASAGRGFRAPSVAELFTATEVGGFLVVPNPDLAPERSWAGELGLQRLVTSWLAFDVAGFFYDFEDLIEADTTATPAGEIEVSFDNVPEAEIRGVEAIARISLFGDRLFGRAGYTFLDTQDGRGAALAYRPDHLLTASGTLTLGNLKLGADYRFASAFEEVQVFTDPRTDPLVDMKVLDLRLAYRVGDQMLRFQVDNAANYAYTTIERNLEPIRRYTVGLDLEF